MELFLLFLFLLPQELVFANIVLKVCLVIFELFGTVNERLMTPLLLFFQLLDLLIHRVIGKFCKEHFFFLVDELIDILGALFSWELDATPSDVHCLMNMVLLL